MLNDPSRYQEQVQKLIELIPSDFEGCERFFDVYYSGGSNVADLLTRLATKWKEFVPTVIASSNNIAHVAELIAGLPQERLAKLAAEFPMLSEFVAENLTAILAHFPELEPARLEDINVEVKELASIEEHSRILREMWGKGLFELTFVNLEYAYGILLGEGDTRPLYTQNFSTIRSLKNPILLDRVERDFDRYLRDIILKLPDNSMEAEPAILDIIRRDGVPQSALRKFLELQEARLTDLADVPEELHAMLFELSAIEPSWMSCLAFLEGSGFVADILIEYLNQDDVRSVILEQPIPDSEEAKKLRLFLVNANSLSDASYIEYARALPRRFEFVPEEIDHSKLKILIEEQKLVFTSEILGALGEHDDLQVLFVATNVESYLAASDDFALDDGFREQLLKSEIDQVTKCEILKLMDLNALVAHPERSALIGPIIDSADVSSFNLNGDVVQALIEHSKPISTRISLINKCHGFLTKDELRALLAKLPKPYSEIKTGYRIPRLENSPQNRDLASMLDSRDIISSWSEGGFFSTDIRVNLYRS